MRADFEKILNEYKLSEAEINEISGNIKELLTYDKTPSQNPIAVIVGGQQGAGKSGLIGYTEQMFKNGNVVVIENDDFRCFHPRINELSKNHPNLYTELTDQLGLGITSDILSYVVENNYNLIFHQTLKNNRIADDAITTLLGQNYQVIVRALAVHKLESKMSMIERCQGQLETKGFCRYIQPSGHDAAYNGIPQTVDYIEKTGKYNLVEIFRRGRLPSTPIKVYSHFNPDTQDKTSQVLKDLPYVSYESDSFGYNSAEDAIERGREQDAQKVSKTLNSRIENIQAKTEDNPEMSLHIKEIKEVFKEYKATQDTSSVNSAQK